MQSAKEILTGQAEDAVDVQPILAAVDQQRLALGVILTEALQ